MSDFFSFNFNKLYFFCVNIRLIRIIRNDFVREIMKLQVAFRYDIKTNKNNYLTWNGSSLFCFHVIGGGRDGPIGSRLLKLWKDGRKNRSPG